MAKRSKITAGSGNIFADLGFENPEQHQVKAHLVMLLSKMIEAQNLTQVQAASRMGLRQPDVSKLLRGVFDGFSLERLLNFVQALGADVEIKIKTGKSRQPRRSNPEGRIRLTA
jgi:predicted XRE-type DNA-binding protein